MLGGGMKNQFGLVSIFVVIFSSLIVTIVTISFVSLMIRNQQQATDADLSNSAYDAAMAGVEDAKRLMLLYRSCEAKGLTTPACNNARAGMVKQSDGQTKCNSIKHGLYGDNSQDEVKIQRSEITGGDTASEALNQAYTCVKIKYDTDVLPGSIRRDSTDTIPLNTGGSPFDRIIVKWFMKKSTDSRSLGLYTDSGRLLLPSREAWQSSNPANQVVPPIMRAQFIQIGNSFNLSDFDQDGTGQSNTNTVFLYPTTLVTGVSPTEVSFVANDTRPANASKKPVAVNCDSVSYNNGGYACSATILVGQPVGGGVRTMAYLRLTPLYSMMETDFQVQLQNGSDTNPTRLLGFPQVDSTGRAGDLFRRVKATVRFESDFAYPKAAVDTNGNLCKDFRVTDKSGDYLSNCTP
jgi:hypothetical protein